MAHHKALPLALLGMVLLSLASTGDALRPHLGRRSLAQAEEPVIATAPGEEIAPPAPKPGKPKAGAKAPPKPTPTPKPTAQPVTLSIAAELFNASGIAEQLAANATVATIFAPSDAAFNRLARSLNLTDAAALLADPFLANLSTSILPLHIVPGAALFAENITAEPITVTSLAGLPLTIERTGTAGVVTVTVEGANVAPENVARVVRADLPFNGSVVHVINRVLLPPGAANITEAEPSEPSEPSETAETTGAAGEPGPVAGAAAGAVGGEAAGAVPPPAPAPAGVEPVAPVGGAEPPAPGTTP